MDPDKSGSLKVKAATEAKYNSEPHHRVFYGDVMQEKYDPLIFQGKGLFSFIYEKAALSEGLWSRIFPSTLECQAIGPIPQSSEPVRVP